MLRFTLFALLIGVVVGLKLSAKMHSQWKLFKSTHSKKYIGRMEEARKQIFVKNVMDIDEHNKRYHAGNESYYLGINQFADMTQEEFRNTILVSSSHPPMSVYNSYKDYNYQYDPNLKVPSHYDARDDGLVTSVKHQGQCGSCWAFATVAAIEVAWTKKYGFYSKKLFSEQQLMECPDQQRYRIYQCKGGNPYDAIEYIYDNGGINTVNCYPNKYTATNGTYCYYQNGCLHAKVRNGLLESEVEHIKQVVFRYGQVIVSLDASAKSFGLYGGGVYDTPCSPKTDNTTHVAVIVGYGTYEDKNNRRYIDYWLVKNSWGQEWGEGGYIRIIRNKNLCNVEAYPIFAVIQDY